MQFLALTSSPMAFLVWKLWASLKCKIFAWLVLQNRVWTADRLARREWQNCGLCKLCNQHQKSATHILFKCRYSIRVWSNLQNWLGIDDLNSRRFIVQNRSNVEKFRPICRAKHCCNLF
jgi:hypothetical protein